MRANGRSARSGRLLVATRSPHKLAELRELLHLANAELVSLDELLRRADLVTLHCPATGENRHLIDATRLALMKPTAHLINTARGTLVDEAALHEALATGRLAGAGLDVFEKEPLFDSALFGLDNVILSPHVAGIDETSEVAMADRAIDAILAVWRGDAPPRECVVNPEALPAR